MARSDGGTVFSSPWYLNMRPSIGLVEPVWPRRSNCRRKEEEEEEEEEGNRASSAKSKSSSMQGLLFLYLHICIYVCIY